MKAAFIITAALCAVATACASVTVDFANGTWDHSGSPSTGWDANETTGSTDVLYGPNNTPVTVTLTQSEQGFIGFPGTGQNSGSVGPDGIQIAAGFSGNSAGQTPTNYVAWTFTFSSAVNIVDWTIGDIDGDSFGLDAVAVEGWDTTPGAIGTGIDPTWNLGSNLQQQATTGTTSVEAVTLAAGAPQVDSPASDPAQSASFTIDNTTGGGLMGFTVYLFRMGSGFATVFGGDNNLALAYE